MVDESHYFLGIDGGGTGCRARLTNTRGQLLGEGVGGPANLALGIDVAVKSVMEAVYHALGQASVGASVLKLTHAGLGMAAANVPKHREALESTQLPFMSVAIRSDAEVACLGAHGGNDGGILILGTGSQGVVFQDGSFHTVGGWGFALSDSGSGSILGRAAVRRAFLAHEGIETPSLLTNEVMRRFNFDLVAMLEWAEKAKPRDWADFARLVFSCAKQEDKVALELVLESAGAAERMLDRMLALGTARICLMGGLAQPIKPYLSQRFNDAIVEPEGDAMDGALLLARAQADDCCEHRFAVPAKLVP
ncbi:BadF/BadG/BcrA/BcrD ATPase family protein [Noviherbaspirillum sp.]|jgi:glucosamine kinase|uniref:BadF/BadG/BcrA/BcrD ATPase family protein n=1 Tax=Noviherbaspirillum sp. TaxID=1926288 RepID=UPI0025EFA6E8|nr:BadF/BadG/BcrA/BcrD ATPase family protein [Noviherbaspirillum sp.]